MLRYDLRKGIFMKTFVTMTALALVLASPAARAEYTGGGAMAPSSSVSSTVDQKASDAKTSMKDHLQKFKDDHEQTWEKLKAERAAHWHGISMHVSKGDTADSAPATGKAMETASASTSPDEGGSGSAPVSDSGQRPSRWESFKENHQDGIASVKDHAETAKTHLESGKDKVKESAQHFEDTHQDKVDAAKDKLHQFEDNHQDTIDAAKDKWHAWRDKHSSN